jgi:Domain of unknown function (DUF4258)
LAEIRKRLVYRVHSVQRMVERAIDDDDVRKILAVGKEIESYPADFPYPSRLLLGWCGPRPIHVVAADNAEDNETIIVTVYEPDPDRWEPGFERRKAQ